MSTPPSPVDRERSRDPHPFDRPDGYSGQDYTAAQEREMGCETPPGGGGAAEGRDLPPDAGHRARIDPASGAVQGSGAGIGGGNPGEDFDTATPSGDSYPLTGGEGTDHPPVAPGPARLRE